MCLCFTPTLDDTGNPCYSLADPFCEECNPSFDSLLAEIGRAPYESLYDQLPAPSVPQNESRRAERPPIGTGQGLHNLVDFTQSIPNECFGSQQPPAPIEPLKKRSTLDPEAPTFTPQRSPVRPILTKLVAGFSSELPPTATPATPVTPVTPTVRVDGPRDEPAHNRFAQPTPPSTNIKRPRRYSSPARRWGGVSPRRASNTGNGAPVLKHIQAQGHLAPVSPREWIEHTYLPGCRATQRRDMLPPTTPASLLHPTTPTTPTTPTRRIGPYFCTFKGCKTPTKPWPTKNAFQKHTNTHMPIADRPFGCSVCSARFLYPKDVKKHEEAIHAHITFPCEFCGDEISRMDNLRRHQAQMHPVFFQGASTPGSIGTASAASPAMSATASFVYSAGPATPTTPTTSNDFSFQQLGSPLYQRQDGSSGRPDQHQGSSPMIKMRSAPGQLPQPPNSRQY